MGINVNDRNESKTLRTYFFFRASPSPRDVWTGVRAVLHTCAPACAQRSDALLCATIRCPVLANAATQMLVGAPKCARSVAIWISLYAAHCTREGHKLVYAFLLSAAAPADVRCNVCWGIGGGRVGPQLNSACVCACNGVGAHYPLLLTENYRNDCALIDLAE